MCYLRFKNVRKEYFWKERDMLSFMLITSYSVRTMANLDLIDWNQASDSHLRLGCMIIRSERFFDVFWLTRLICWRLLLERAGSGLVLCTREVIEKSVVECCQLRALERLHGRGELVDCPAEDGTELAERGSSGAGHTGESGLVEETSSIISFEKRSAVEDAAGDVGGIDTSEGVCSAGVSSKANDAGEGLVVDPEVLLRRVNWEGSDDDNSSV